MFVAFGDDEAVVVVVVVHVAVVQTADKTADNNKRQDASGVTSIITVKRTAAHGMMLVEFRKR